MHDKYSVCNILWTKNYIDKLKAICSKLNSGWAALNIVHVCFIITVLLFIRDLKLQCSVYLLSMIVALLT